MAMVTIMTQGLYITLCTYDCDCYLKDLLLVRCLNGALPRAHDNFAQEHTCKTIPCSHEEPQVIVYPSLIPQSKSCLRWPVRDWIETWKLVRSWLETFYEISFKDV